MFDLRVQGTLIASILLQNTHGFLTPRPQTSFILNAAKDEILNPLISSIQISKTVELFSLVKKLQSEGIEVTSLCVGEPDFPPPQAILSAAISALTDGDTKYTALSGTPALRTAIALDLQTRKNLTYAPDEILVSNGAKQSVYQGLLALCGAGDAVLIPAPYWPSYPEMVLLTGATPVVVDTIPNGCLLTPEVLRRALEDSPEAKLLILCNPSNPSGVLHPPALLKDLAEVLRDFPRVFVLADEIYERLVYDEASHVSFASLPGMWERTLTVNGFSKAYAMTGMRVGYLAAPPLVVDACVKIQSQLTSCAGSVSQRAAVAALTDVGEEEMGEINKIMQSKRDYVLGELTDMGFVFDNVNLHAFYILLDVSDYCGEDDIAFAMGLLDKKRLAITPGSGFGAKGTVRISYATSFEDLRLAMDKLREFLQEYSS